MTPPLQVIVADAVPLGPPGLLGTRLLLSVRGLPRRPQLPATGRIVQSGEGVRLLEVLHSPTLWLLTEVTLLAELQGAANWRAWTGCTLLISGESGEAEHSGAVF